VKQMNVRSVIAWAAKLTVAGVFVYAGALKVIHPEQLQVDIERYRLISSTMAWRVAAMLPYLEIFSALALLHPRAAAGGRIMLATLLVVFIAALISAWMRGLNVACGCFGNAAAEKPNYAWWISRDLMLLATLGWLHRRDKHAAVPKPPRELAEIVASEKS
jgi:putative oxidoreductase